ncbi:MAG: hypothetical protein HY820_26265 [Acidobacteria bacterium]|nr:hypothetical protein [Acidobacteriota bacterium]
MKPLLLFWIASLALGQDVVEWKTLPAADGPSGRVDGVLAYDARSRTVYMFGGRDGSPRNDLWSYSLDRQEWSEVPASGALPAARFGHTLIMDARRGQLVLFGGQAGGFFSDTWAFDISSRSWRQLAPDNAGPSRRYGHSGVYDGVRDRMIISHGFTDSGRFDDTWTFDLATNRWRDVSPAPGSRPLRRCLHHAVIDDAGNQMLLYGGCSSGAGPCPQGDLWSFDLAAHRWTEIRGSTKPPGRQWYGGAFDSERRRLLIFGGSGDLGNLNDTWEFDTAAQSWTKLAIDGPPAPRERQEAVFAAGTGAIFFGGATDRGLTNELLLLRATPVVGNALSRRSGPLAPGGLVNIAVAGLDAEGEVVTAADEQGMWPLGAAGVTVRFNGIAAPVVSWRRGEITVQTPYEVSGLSSVAMMVERDGASVITRGLIVAEVSPGIPSQVKASEDGTVVIPLTGAGNLIPAVATGVLDTSSSAVPAAAITVTAGDAEVPVLSVRHSMTPGILEVQVTAPQLSAGETRIITVRVNGESASTTLVAE